MSKYIKLDDAIDRKCPFEDVWEDCIDCPLDNKADEPCKMGKWIKSLPTIEVSEDCVSREYILGKAFMSDEYNRETKCFDLPVVSVRDIEDAPSVVPKQSSKVGEWQITDAYPHNVYCSECHKKFAQTHWAVWEDGSLSRNYCPNCGARMKGAE